MTALRGLLFVAALVAVLFPFILQAPAQVDTGAIVGTISDSAGLRIPGAKVIVTEESTGVSTTVTTDADGSYIISPLKLGRYTLKAEKEGFKISVQQHIEVTLQSRLEVNQTLQIGAVSESVQVSSTAPILETQTSSLQQLVDTQPINDLPLNRRNATFLAQLSAGVMFAQNGARGLQASGSFTANGFGLTENDYMLDGMDDKASDVFQLTENMTIDRDKQQVRTVSNISTSPIRC